MFKKIKDFFQYFLDYFSNIDIEAEVRRQHQEDLARLYHKQLANRSQFAEISMLVELTDKGGVTNVAISVPGKRADGSLMTAIYSINRPAPHMPPKSIKVLGIDQLINAAIHFHNEQREKTVDVSTTMRLSCIIRRTLVVSEVVMTSIRRIHRINHETILQDTTYGEVFLSHDFDDYKSVIPAIDISNVR